MHAMRHTLEPTTAAAASPDCLGDDAIASLADGTIDATGRAAALPHLGACARCRGAVASVARTLSVPEVSRTSRLAAGAFPRGWYRAAFPIAAGVGLLVLVRPWDNRERAPNRHRAPTIEAGEAPRGVFPVDTVDLAKELRWTSVAGADRYRVTLFDASGQVLYERQVADTFTTIPDSLRLSPANEYLWKVDARTGFDRWVTSVFFRFSLQVRPPR